MMNEKRLVLFISLLLLTSIMLALITIKIQRVGPEVGIYGNVCGPDQDQFCYRELVKGGFPFAYLYDRPGVSVPGKLEIAVDDFHLQPFLVNIGLYFILQYFLYFTFSKFARGKQFRAQP